MAAAVFGLREDLARGIRHVMLGQRFADIDALRDEEGVRHPAADHQIVDLGDEIAQQLQFGGDFRAADHSRHRPLRRAQSSFQRFELRRHQATRAGGQDLGDTDRRGMGAVRRREGIIHINFAKRRHGSGQFAIVLFLARVETGVLQQQNLALLQPCYGSLRGAADAIAGEFHRKPQRGLECRHQSLQRHLRHNLALGPPEMRQQNRLAARRDNIFHRGHDFLNARVIRHPSAFQRHVDIDPNQNNLAVQIHIVERFPSHVASPQR